MNNKTNFRRTLSFYAPMILYFGFILVFLVTRLLLFSLLTGNAQLNPQRLPRQYNLQFFRTISSYFNPAYRIHSYLDFVGNILLLVPMGVYVYTLRKKRSVFLSSLFCLFCITLIESLQFILATGSFDVDDILLNFLGALMGIAVGQLLLRCCKNDAALSRHTLSAVSTAVIPLLITTVFAYGYWSPSKSIFPLCLLVLAVLYTTLYVFLFRSEARRSKIIYSISGMSLSLLFFLFVLPMVAPWAYTV